MGRTHMRLNKPEQGKENLSLTPPQQPHPAPGSPERMAVTISVTYPLTQLEVDTRPTHHTPLTSPQTPIQPSSAPQHPTSSHNPSLLKMTRLAYLYSWCRDFVRGVPPLKRPTHLRMPSAPFRACRWLWRKVGVMNLCICVCVGGLGVLTGVAVAITDNYSCEAGVHEARRGDTAWSMVSRLCSGDRTHALEDVAALNPTIETWGLVQGDVVILPKSGG